MKYFFHLPPSIDLVRFFTEFYELKKDKSSDSKFYVTNFRKPSTEAGVKRMNITNDSIWRDIIFCCSLLRGLAISLDEITYSSFFGVMLTMTL